MTTTTKTTTTSISQITTVEKTSTLRITQTTIPACLNTKEGLNNLFLKFVDYDNGLDVCPLSCNFDFDSITGDYYWVQGFYLKTFGDGNATVKIKENNSNVIKTLTSPLKLETENYLDSPYYIQKLKLSLTHGTGSINVTSFSIKVCT